MGDFLKKAYEDKVDIQNVQKLLDILNPEFVCKSSELRVLVDGHVFPIKKISCHYVYGDKVKKSVFLEV